MKLDLVAMAGDVEAIAEKATKEAHQENSLMLLQSTWDRIEFSVTASTETDTPLVSMSEEDLEVTSRGTEKGQGGISHLLVCPENNGVF